MPLPSGSTSSYSEGTDTTTSSYPALSLASGTATFHGTYAGGSDSDYFIIDQTGGSTEYTGSIAAGTQLTFTVQVSSGDQLGIQYRVEPYSSLSQFGPSGSTQFYLQSVDHGSRTLSFPAGEVIEFQVLYFTGPYTITITRGGSS